MSALITLDRVAVATPDGRLLFDNLTLAFGRERTGLVGRNGAGKSTLLRLLAGELEPLRGAVTRAGSVGVLRQRAEPAPGATVADLLGVADGMARLARVLAGKGSQADLEAADWALTGAVDSALADVGLGGMDPARPAAELSGGQQTRAALGALWLARPDIILLDEPTNHLDAAGRRLVAEALERWPGGAVAASHDRALLRGMDRIIELSSLGPRLHGGGWDVYDSRRQAERAAAERDLETAAREAQRVEREVQLARERQARRDAAGRRFAARGSEPKMLLDAQAERAERTAARGGRLAVRQRQAAGEALEAARARVERARSLGFDLPSTGLAPGRPVLAFERVAFAYPGGAPVLSDVSFSLTGPARASVEGANGAGKSTLLQLAAGLLEPVRGVVRRSARAVMLDQAAAILAPDQSVLDNFRRINPWAGVNEAHAALARFLFRNAAAHQTVDTLSGGERLRAALACVLSGRDPPQLLILDEPTNHLDLPSIEAVEAALGAYDGALLLVSHDPDFLAAAGIFDQIILG